MADTSDIVIVGGGVIGLTTAYFMAREGLRVTILDRQDFGREASWAGAGIIPPGNPDRAASPFDRLRAVSSVSFPKLSNDLRERTGIDNGYVRSGGLEFAAGHETSSPEEWRGAGIQVEAVDEARGIEPALAAVLGPACHLPDLAQLRNPRHIQALVSACANLGVTLRSACPARAWVMRDQRVCGLQADTETFVAGKYLLATGAWTDSLLASLGLQLNIQPVRGQIALLNPGRPLFRPVLLWGDRYLVPRQDGRVLVGSTEEHVGFDRRTTAGAQHELLQLACHLVPALANAEVERCWAGLRPGSPDGLPFLGTVPGHNNVLVAAGHYRAGIQLSPGTAMLLTDMVLGRALTIPEEPFRLDRHGEHR